MPAWGWIEQSDAHIIQNTEQTDWQLLGPSSYESPWKRQRERQKRKDCWWLRWCSQCCVLLLCMSHCWRPSLSGQSRVSPETPASLLECPGGNSAPGGGKDRSTDTRYVHSALESGLLRKTGQAIEQPVWNHSTSSGVPTTLRDSFTTFLHNPMKTTVSFHLWTTWLYKRAGWMTWMNFFVCLLVFQQEQSGSGSRVRQLLWKSHIPLPAPVTLFSSVQRLMADDQGNRFPFSQLYINTSLSSSNSVRKAASEFIVFHAAWQSALVVFSWVSSQSYFHSSTKLFGFSPVNM